VRKENQIIKTAKKSSIFNIVSRLVILELVEYLPYKDLTYEQSSGEKTFQTSMHGDWHWQPALSAG
ncbi:MAG: hypothetical protein J7J70_00880, partial [Deltaproteobacteria bacterium]|nr:hypothetical protein [Candidatus Tharpellaceae bacterium]